MDFSFSFLFLGFHSVCQRWGRRHHGLRDGIHDPVLVHHVIDGRQRGKKKQKNKHIRITSNIAGPEMEKRVGTSEARPLGIQPFGSIDPPPPPPQECRQL